MLKLIYLENTFCCWALIFFFQREKKSITDCILFFSVDLYKYYSNRFPGLIQRENDITCFGVISITFLFRNFALSHHSMWSGETRTLDTCKHWRCTCTTRKPMFAFPQGFLQRYVCFLRFNSL